MVHLPRLVILGDLEKKESEVKSVVGVLTARIRRRGRADSSDHRAPRLRPERSRPRESRGPADAVVVPRYGFVSSAASGPAASRARLCERIPATRGRWHSLAQLPELFFNVPIDVPAPDRERSEAITTEFRDAAGSLPTPISPARAVES